MGVSTVMAAFLGAGATVEGGARFLTSFGAGVVSAGFEDSERSWGSTVPICSA